ncbi:MAG: hypothetical protein ACI3XR_03085 [Eubacteriales bacterium]
MREIRIRRPEVIVTHDEAGENYHNSHKVTAKALEEAVVKAADPAYDPESAVQYGVWQVSKLYSHLYGKNQITLDYHQPLESFGGRTAYEVATAAYAHHESQQDFYQLTWSAIQPGGKYDNSLFGCVFSTVGYDQVDLFYGTSVYRGDSDQPPAQTTTEQPPTTTVPVTSPPVTTEPEPSETTVNAPPETTPETTPVMTPAMTPVTTPETTPGTGSSTASPIPSDPVTTDPTPITDTPVGTTEQSPPTVSTGAENTGSQISQNIGRSAPQSKILIAFAMVVILIAAILAFVFIRKKWRRY